MARRTRFLAVAGGVVALGVAAWFGTTHLATQRAEAAVIDLLQQRGLRDHVHWRSLSATPLGSVTLREVTVTGPDAVTALTLDAVTISDLQHHATQSRGRLGLRGVSAPDGNSPLADLPLVHAGGVVALPPMHADVAWDLDRVQGDATVSVAIDQPEALRAEADVSIVGLAPILEALTTGAISPMDPGSVGPKVWIELGGPIGLVRGRVAVTDQGHVTRSLALHKRYAYALDAQGASPAEQRDAAFAQAVQKEEVDCPAALAQFGAEDSCKAILAFVSGQEKSLTVRADPPVVVVLGQALPHWAFGSRQTVMRQLNVTTSND
ncbi:hypothetical protein IMZ29_17370 [Achromobacter sp. GG226]|uniref:hypothetical protein n=1 Tax=Verticiella alkaliphila TaxID=2779529 RepID=UPI001C0D79D9|nr:hypothetical protein [Verticiella sp. GG226]MBU4612247.1 hypothetical protein [Verticiella sp. GG226]